MTKPILFNTEMVRAILEGRKTATRRVVKGQKDGWELLTLKSNDVMVKVRVNAKEYKEKYVRLSGLWATFVWDGIPGLPMVKAPCEPGDYLWVRETWRKDVGRYMYRANYSDNEKFYRAGEEVSVKWRPSIHMPKEAARLFLRVTGVRMERLQDITEEGALAEGVPNEWPMAPVYCPYCKGEGLVGAVHPVSLSYMDVDCPQCAKATSRFANLWNSTIKPADRPLYGWEANPWVWVIQFERCEKPEGYL